MVTSGLAFQKHDFIERASQLGLCNALNFTTLDHIVSVSGFADKSLDQLGSSTIYVDAPDRRHEVFDDDSELPLG